VDVLLDASADGKASKLVAASTQRIRCVAVDTGLSMLIRSDSCIAWADEQNSTDGLEDSLPLSLMQLALHRLGSNKIADSRRVLIALANPALKECPMRVVIPGRA